MFKLLQTHLEPNKWQCQCCKENLSIYLLFEGKVVVALFRCIPQIWSFER